MPVLSVTDATFENEVLRSEQPVLLDLYADWCAPCKQLAPIMEQLSSELTGRLKVVKIDVERSPMVAQMFRVQSIPMIALVAEGRVADHHVGLLDKTQLLEMVKPFLGQSPSAAAEVDTKVLAELLSTRRALPIDIRDAQAYSRFHIPGALNIAAADLESRVADLAPRDGRVRILYGRTSDDAKPAVEALRQKGVEVGFLAGGFLHWEADGFEVERGGPN